MVACHRLRPRGSDLGYGRLLRAGLPAEQGARAPTRPTRRSSPTASRPPDRRRRARRVALDRRMRPRPSRTTAPSSRQACRQPVAAAPARSSSRSDGSLELGRRVHQQAGLVVPDRLAHPAGRPVGDRRRPLQGRLDHGQPPALAHRRQQHRPPPTPAPGRARRRPPPDQVHQVTGPAALDVPPQLGLPPPRADDPQPHARVTAGEGDSDVDRLLEPLVRDQPAERAQRQRRPRDVLQRPRARRRWARRAPDRPRRAPRGRRRWPARP